MEMTMRIGASTLALVVIGVVPAAAFDLPTRKPGLWELKTTAEGQGTPMVMKQCVDAETDAQMQAFGASMSAKMCDQEVKREGGGIVTDAVCRMGPITMRTHSVTTGDFNSAYTTKTTSKQEGGPSMPGMGGESAVTIEARWTGPCEAGQRPGDVIMANGMKMNINDMKKFMPGGAPPR
ncbi:MAG: DUF3617 family protein [Xanthobacteraceae bacterium]